MRVRNLTNVPKIDHVNQQLHMSFEYVSSLQPIEARCLSSRALIIQVHGKQAFI